MDRTLLRTVTLLALGALASGSGCETRADPAAAGSPARPDVAKAAAPRLVAVTTAARQSWPRTVRVQGSLLAYENAVIGSKLAGRVERVEVDLGSVVRRGQPMVVLDASELDLRVRLAQSQLEQACAAIALTPEDDEANLKIENAAPVMLEKAMLDEAQSALERGRPLVATRAMTASQLDTFVAQERAAQARYNSAVNAVREQIALIGVRRTELALAQQQLADAHILAPFDGVVDERRVSPGEYVQVGQAVVTLIRSDRLRFTAGVPENHARGVRLGQPVKLEVAGIDRPPDASVCRISPVVTQTSRAVRLEADVPNAAAKLQAGLFAEAEIVVDSEARALSVPASAVTRFAGVQKVWQVVDGQARQVSVRTGREDEGRIEILSGLEAGDQVVATAAQGHDGPVIVSNGPANDATEIPDS
jgi:RND family efflux transporter MFP subunit